MSILLAERPPECVEDDELITTGEAARLLGVSTTTIVRMAEAGDLIGYRINFQHRISKRSVLEYKERSRIEPQVSEVRPLRGRVAAQYRKAA